VSNSHVGIELPVERLNPGKSEPVKSPDLVRTVLRTEEGSDTAVVDLIVETIDTVVGRKHGTYRFAGGIITVLTEHGEKPHPGLLLFKIAFDPEPGHLPSPYDLLLADERNVVLRITGDHTGATTDTAVKVNNHNPSIVGVRVSLINIVF
jgi:hypothetical protein